MKIIYAGGTISLECFKDFGTNALQIIFDDESGNDVCYTATADEATRVAYLLKLGALEYESLLSAGMVSDEIKKFMEEL